LFYYHGFKGALMLLSKGVNPPPPLLLLNKRVNRRVNPGEMGMRLSTVLHHDANLTRHGVITVVF